MASIGKSISVSTTKLVVDPGDPDRLFTFINKGPNSIYYRSRIGDGNIFIGTGNEIVALGGGELEFGQTATINGVAWNVVCATGESATLRVVPGRLEQSVDIGVASGSGLTFTNFDLDESVAGIADLGTSAAGALIRLHELNFTMLAQGSVEIGYDDDGAGTNAVVLRGPYPFGAGAGMNIEYNADPRGAIEAPDGKHLTITFITAGGGGGGRISTGA